MFLGLGHELFVLLVSSHELFLKIFYKLRSEIQHFLFKLYAPRNGYSNLPIFLLLFEIGPANQQGSTMIDELNADPLFFHSDFPGE